MLLKYPNSVKAFALLLAIGVCLVLLDTYKVRTYILAGYSTDEENCTDCINTHSDENIRMECKEWFFDNQDVMQNNSDILKYLRKHHLTPPSKDSYQLIHPKTNPSQFSGELKKLFGEKKNGFFIESGANDGEYLSNTLALERDQNWTGLLIEPNSFLLPELRKKNRKAWIADVCLSLKTYPQKVKFLHRSGKQHEYFKGMGVIEAGEGNDPFKDVKGRDPKNYESAGVVDCFPLFSLLSAINVAKVDYFSLDIEGVELKVIQAIPFDSVDIRVMSVEANLIPEGIPALIKYMESKGFNKSSKVANEIYFVKKTSVLFNV